MPDINDYEVVCDDKINNDLMPAGLMVWPKETFNNSAMARVNLRRAYFMLIDKRMPLSDSKVSRRSRRRWRGKGGVWQYDPKLLQMFRDAATKVSSH